jgi:hypothetical protein
MNDHPFPGWRWFLLLSIVDFAVVARRAPFNQHMTAFAAPYIQKMDDLSDITGQPPYSIASTDLSTRWIDLVRNDKVATTVHIPDEDGSDILVRYGVRLTDKGGGVAVCEEFVEEACLEPGETNQSNLVKAINETLATYQTDSSVGAPVKFVLNGDFAAQLQLVRTLRPAPSPGFAGATTAVPPEYDPSTDSFVTGPLRLELRPKVASLSQDGMTTSWDVFHNISPADTRGHFLLLPTLADKDTNWRGQRFTVDDSIDLVHLANSIRPVGALFLGYNSVGGAASQNHIHCHAWPSPPIPLLDRPPRSSSDEGEPTDEPSKGWDCYAVSRVKSVFDLYDIDVGGGQLEVSYLEYPVFCVQLSASERHLKHLGNALASTIDVIGDAPHNIGFLNRLQEVEGYEEPQTFTDVYVFARSKERSSHLPSLKLGISEMMGVFHAQSDDELKILGRMSTDDETGLMSKALSDISYADEQALWTSIKQSLEALVV